MAQRCLLYYITDRTQFPGDEHARRRALLAKIAEAAHAGVDYIQLREKDLSTRELEHLARESRGMIQQVGAENRELRTRLLINSRSDVALATDADGVHLRSEDVSPLTVRSIWAEVIALAPQTGSQSDAQRPLIAALRRPGAGLLAAVIHAVGGVFLAGMAR